MLSVKFKARQDSWILAGLFAFQEFEIQELS